MLEKFRWNHDMIIGIISVEHLFYSYFWRRLHCSSCDVLLTFLMTIGYICNSIKKNACLIYGCYIFLYVTFEEQVSLAHVMKIIWSVRPVTFVTWNLWNHIVTLMYILLFPWHTGLSNIDQNHRKSKIANYVRKFGMWD